MSADALEPWMAALAESLDRFETPQISLEVPPTEGELDALESAVFIRTGRRVTIRAMPGDPPTRLTVQPKFTTWRRVNGRYRRTVREEDHEPS